VLNLPLAPSLVRRGFIGPTYPCGTGRSLRVSGINPLKYRRGSAHAERPNRRGAGLASP
jgi:hypothetical protein